MAVIVDMALPDQAFELGQILTTDPGTSVELETVVPLGERPVPFLRVYEESTSFKQTVQNHPVVKTINKVRTSEEGTLYSLDWDVSKDTFFAGLQDMNGTVLRAYTSEDSWEFSLRFTSHEAMADFEAYCENEEIPIAIERLFNPTRPEAGPWYGLTPIQRESLTRAVEEGYYSIPRQISTNGLAEEAAISDQAMTERLRRGIMGLVSNTLLVDERDDTH